MKAIFLSIVVITVVVFQASDDRTKIVFCDVGQGDATYIRIKNRVDILIDAGPDRKILSCLGKHMPFYDRKIELVILTHEERDHYGGLSYIVTRYQIGEIASGSFNKDNTSFSELLKDIEEKNIATKVVRAGSKIFVEGGSFDFYWPIETSLVKTKNELSLNCLFREGGFRVFFSGDSSPLTLSLIISRTAKSRLAKLKNATILKIPHHGSKNGLTVDFLKLVNPQIAVISAGKNNPYGHPAREILDMLSKFDIKVRRTDREGNIVFKIPNTEF